MQGLDRFGTDYKRALEQVPFSYRTFWIHSFQSHVWNACAHMRLQVFGTRPIVGDLYLENGTGVVRILEERDLAVSDEVLNEMMQQIVLPLSGKGVLLPQNAVGQVKLSLFWRYHTIAQM